MDKKSFNSSIDDMVGIQLESMSISLVVPKSVDIIVSSDDGSIIKVVSGGHTLDFKVGAEGGTPDIGGVSIDVKKTRKGTTYRVMFRGEDGEYIMLKEPNVITSEPVEEEKKEDSEELELIDLEVGLLDTLEMPLMGLEGTAQAHVDKHGEEFEVDNIKDYTKKAQIFGKAQDKKYRIAVIGKTTIKVDPDTGWVLIAQGKRIRTFYVWDKKYSDPLAYAIYYTITHNQGIPLAKYGNLDALLEEGIDLVAMEKEVVIVLHKEGIALKSISEITLVSIESIKEILEIED